jgi:hypothetical protein
MLAPALKTHIQSPLPSGERVRVRGKVMFMVKTKQEIFYVKSAREL